MITLNTNTPQSNINFQAKFLHSEDLKKVVDYAVEKGKFEKLNTARKNIDSAHFTTRLKLDILQNQNGKNIVRFSTFKPKKNASVPYSLNEYELVKTTDYVNNKKENPLKFAFEKIIKLSNNAPHNNMYKNIVNSK